MATTEEQITTNTTTTVAGSPDPAKWRPLSSEDYLRWMKGAYDINVHGLMEVLTEEINGFTEAWKRAYAEETDPDLRAHLREQVGHIQDALATHAAMLDKLAQ